MNLRTQGRQIFFGGDGRLPRTGRLIDSGLSSINAAVEQIIPEMVRHLAQHTTNSVGVIIVTAAAVIHGVPAGAMGMAFQ
jgi:hypothetical protein